MELFRICARAISGCQPATLLCDIPQRPVPEQRERERARVRVCISEEELVDVALSTHLVQWFALNKLSP